MSQQPKLCQYVGFGCNEINNVALTSNAKHRSLEKAKGLLQT